MWNYILLLITGMSFFCFEQPTSCMQRPQKSGLTQERSRKSDLMASLECKLISLATNRSLLEEKVDALRQKTLKLSQGASISECRALLTSCVTQWDQEYAKLQDALEECGQSIETSALCPAFQALLDDSYIRVRIQFVDRCICLFDCDVAVTQLTERSEIQEYIIRYANEKYQLGVELRRREDEQRLKQQFDSFGDVTDIVNLRYLIAEYNARITQLDQSRRVVISAPAVKQSRCGVQTFIKKDTPL